MFQYMDKITNILKVVNEKENEAIQKAIELITIANLNKKSIYIFGASHAGILMEEMYYRAGGMMTINPIFGREVMLDRTPITFTSQMERLEGYGTNLAKTVHFKENDVLILHSVSGRNPIIIDIAFAAREQGVKLIGLTNVSYSKSVESRHSSGKKLFEIVDVLIDNHGDIGDACCRVKGISQKVGASSTVIGASILNTIIVESCQKLVEKGIKNPPIFYSANLDGGDKLNRELYEKYKSSIHYHF